MPPTGVLLTNLGTPDAPPPPALRKFLREFLWDRRVIDLPRLKWWLILNLFVLPFRPKKSAELYRNIWTPEGSPLLVIARKQRDAVAAALDDLEVHVALGMRYGSPSIRSALDELQAAGCERLVVLPLYAQYACSTTESTYDAVSAALKGWAKQPELRKVTHYYDERGYLEALAASVRELWEREGEPDRLLFSFHGIPQRMADEGDPYCMHCRETARAVAALLELAPGRWYVAFQSQFGKEQWLKPASDATLKAWAPEGVSVDTICPGFSADCLETLEEVNMTNRELFEQAGGGRYRYVPALTERVDHVAALATIIRANLDGWS